MCFVCGFVHNNTPNATQTPSQTQNQSPSHTPPPHTATTTTAGDILHMCHSVAHQLSTLFIMENIPRHLAPRPFHHHLQFVQVYLLLQDCSGPGSGCYTGGATCCDYHMLGTGHTSDGKEKCNCAVCFVWGGGVCGAVGRLVVVVAVGCGGVVSISVDYHQCTTFTPTSSHTPPHNPHPLTPITASCPLLKHWAARPSSALTKPAHSPPTKCRQSSSWLWGQHLVH